ncbi:serine/threonine protein kinase [Paenibacillus sp. LPE1-1-1.1]|uniref:serine/threonine protein kinase n=1 Tax=Paenibacillus sp. LPE1-1-1.1 TaxID=3135230 RepID=UPI0034355606
MRSFIVGKSKEIIKHWRDFPLRVGLVWMKRYRIERFIGMGSYGQTYACTDIISGNTMLLKRNLPSKKDIGRQLLERESCILKQLDHPQIPKWIRYEKQGKDEALLMELIAGENLEQKIEQGRLYSVQESLSILKELLRPLEHLHQAGYVHRDVRIPNVLDDGRRLYLIDFGLSCRIGEQLPETLRMGLKEPKSFDDLKAHASDGSWSGAKQRMRRPDPASDLYGLGHFFLFMMYAGFEYDEGQAERSWQEELELPLAVKQFVSRLLQRGEPGWASAKSCALELQRLLDSLGDSADPS